MNHPYDTPPDGDFVRYVEQLTSPPPGIVMRKAAPAPQPARPAANPRSNQQPQHRSSQPLSGPPDLAAILRQLLGQRGR